MADSNNKLEGSGSKKIVKKVVTPKSPRNPGMGSPSRNRLGNGGGGGGGMDNDVEKGGNNGDFPRIDIDDVMEEPSPFSVTLCASIYNIFVLAGICSIVVSLGIYVLSFFYFALQFECTEFITDQKLGEQFTLRKYLLVTGSILIVIFMAKLYDSFFLKLVTTDKDVLKTSKVPYFMAVIVFDIFLILGSIVFWRHEDYARERCDSRTHKYLHDVIIVNYATAAYLNNILYILFLGAVKVYEYSLVIFTGPQDTF